MSASTTLTTLAALKIYLGITDSDEDAILDDLIDAVSEWIESFCGRKFASATVTEYHDGYGDARVVLKRRPVDSITSVHDDLDRDYEAAELVDADDYTFYPESGILQHVNGTFQDGIRNVKVVYVAGYATIPDDLALACRMLCAEIYNRAEQGADGIALERVGEYSANYVLMMKEMGRQVKAILSRYRELTVRM